MIVRMWAALVSSFILTLALAQPLQAQTAAPLTVSGTVSYQQRSALPENTVITVRLVDVSRQDVAAIVIAEQQIPANGKSSPIPFTISVEAAKIVASNSYAVQATISTYGQNTFRSTNSYLVLTQGRPATADIVVVPITNQLPNTGAGVVLPMIAVALLLGAGGVAAGRRGLSRRVT